MRFSGFQKTTFSDFPGKVASIVFTHGCNFRCPYCHNPDLVTGTQRERIEEEEVLTYLERRRGRITGLVVTGGEPTIHRGLQDFLAKVRALDVSVKIDTNGSRPAVLERLLSENLVDYVAMDVKAPLQKYDTVAGDTVDTTLVAESIRLIVTSGVDHEFRTTALKTFHSVDDIDEIGHLIHGCQRYVLQPFSPRQTLDLSLTDQDVGFSNIELAAMSERLIEADVSCTVR